MATEGTAPERVHAGPPLTLQALRAAVSEGAVGTGLLNARVELDAFHAGVTDRGFERL